jgi:hypothetical protein
MASPSDRLDAPIKDSTAGASRMRKKKNQFSRGRSGVGCDGPPSGGDSNVFMKTQNRGITRKVAQDAGGFKELIYRGSLAI